MTIKIPSYPPSVYQLFKWNLRKAEDEEKDEEEDEKSEEEKDEEEEQKTD
jgi:hypothetical protein